LLIAFSKVLERVMYNRLKQHIDTDNIIASEQFGFRENRNTETAICTLTNHILKTLEQRRQTVGIFCDLTKAFDCVIHDILLSKLIVYGSGGQLNTSRGPNLTYRTPSRARASVSFRGPAREYCPPPPN
jgi:hypothetical protein